jgi:hypothetical protein
MSASVYPSPPTMGFDHTTRGSNASAMDYMTDASKIEALIARVQALETWTRAVSLPTSNGTKFPTDKRAQDQTVTTESRIVETSASESPDLGDVGVGNKILDIIEMYGISEKTDQALPCKARSTFLPVVLAHIKKGIPIRMVLPAFPFKSPNREGKVLGDLPDLGEEISLACLQGFCNSVSQVYKPGAEISIASDGLMYNGEPLVFELTCNFALLIWT